MKIIQKLTAAALCVFMFTSALVSCGHSKSNANGGKLSVVATIFPEYDWVRQIAGEQADNMDITLLLDNGVDLHSYQSTADDIIKISNCDMFIYVGGESDEWVHDALKEAVNKDMIVINLLEVLGDAVKEEEIVAGMEAEEEDEDEEEETEYDEHVWLSLKNTSVLCRYIADKLCELDPSHEAIYTQNVNAYVEQLNALDAEYQSVVANAAVKTVLFGDRFPFRYLVDDYGLSYYAAFVGCSAETEASFETIVFLANRVDELGLHAILQIESADGSIARTVRDNTKTKDQSILTMDSLQSATSQDAADGVTYLSVMAQNLAVLKDALQ